MGEVPDHSPGQKTLLDQLRHDRSDAFHRSLDLFVDDLSAGGLDVVLARARARRARLHVRQPGIIQPILGSSLHERQTDAPAGVPIIK